MIYSKQLQERYTSLCLSIYFLTPVPCIPKYTKGLLCAVVICQWSILLNPSGLYHWYRCMIGLMLVRKHRRIKVDVSHQNPQIQRLKPLWQIYQILSGTLLWYTYLLKQTNDITRRIVTSLPCFVEQDESIISICKYREDLEQRYIDCNHSAVG